MPSSSVERYFSIYTVSGHLVLAPSMFVCLVLIHNLPVCFSSVCHLLSPNSSDCDVKHVCKDVQLQEANLNYCLYRHIYNLITQERRCSGDLLEQQDYLKREQVLSSAMLNTPSSLTLFLWTVPPNTLFIICNTNTQAS